MRRKAKSPKVGLPSASVPVVTASRFQFWPMVLFLTLVTFLAYQPIWRAGFIWDDDWHVTDNLMLRSVDGLRQIWFNVAATPQYYPFVHSSFWLEYHLWGLNPLGYHLVNVSLQALSAVLLWRVLLRLQFPGAWLAAGIFALHPVMVESVAWVTERKNLLAAVFYFSAALVWLHWTGQGTRDKDHARRSLLWWYLAFALFMAALLSKTITASLPAAILLVTWWKRGRVTGRDVWPLLPFFVAGIAFGGLTSWLERIQVGAQGPEWAFGFPERCLIAGRALWFYVAKLFWPVDLVFTYPRWRISASEWWQWIFPVAALATVVAAWGLRRRFGRGPLAAVLFFSGTLFPALGFINVFPMRFSFVADHFQYLACTGIIVLAASGISMVSGYSRDRHWWLKPVLSGALLLTLGIMTWRQCRMYANIETLWRATIDRNPDSWLAQNNLGVILSGKGQVDAAIEHLDRAVAIEPDYPEGHNNLGNALKSKGDLDGAIVQYQRALAIKPDFAAAQNNLGHALLLKGQGDEAIPLFLKALATQPDFAEAQDNLGMVLFQKGQIEAAIVHFRKASAFKPDFAQAQNNLGTALLQRGQWDEAIVRFQKALAIQPDMIEAEGNLGIALIEKGQIQEAIVHLQRALAIQPGFTSAQEYLARAAWVLATSPNPSIRNGTRAVDLAQQTDRLSGGKNPVMAATLAAAYAEAGRFPEAVASVQRARQLATSQNISALVVPLEAQLKLYQSGLPCRDTGAPR